MQYPNSTGWTNYYFEKNIQGDVIGVYQKEGDGNSATHILAARYSTFAAAVVLLDEFGNPAVAPARYAVERFHRGRRCGIYRLHKRLRCKKPPEGTGAFGKVFRPRVVK